MTIANPEPDDLDHFAYGVAALGDNRLVGAPDDDTDGPDAGIVYLFDGNTGKELVRFHNPKPGAGGLFGRVNNIAAVGDNVLIGNPGVGAYLFDGSTGEVLLTFEPSDRGTFGFSVAAVGSHALVGYQYGPADLFDGKTGRLLRSFRNRSTHTVGGTDGKVLLGTFNEKVDLFTVSDTPGLDVGTGYFVDSGQVLGSSYSFGAALGDLDGDGDLDAIVANYLNSGDHGEVNTVWLNDGTGQFSDSGQSLGNSPSRGIALGDLDGDGDLDAFVANNEKQPNEMWFNDGEGTFSDSGQRLGGSSSHDVVLGDLDGDGDLDGFVVNYGAANRVWLNTDSQIHGRK